MPVDVEPPPSSTPLLLLLSRSSPPPLPLPSPPSVLPSRSFSSSHPSYGGGVGYGLRPGGFRLWRIPYLRRVAALPIADPPLGPLEVHWLPDRGFLIQGFLIQRPGRIFPPVASPPSSAPLMTPSMSTTAPWTTTSAVASAVSLTSCWTRPIYSRRAAGGF